jgi:hypothetical protein
VGSEQTTPPVHEVGEGGRPQMMSANRDSARRLSYSGRWGPVVASDASFAGTRRYPSNRSFATGRATAQTAASRAGSRLRSYSHTPRPAGA